MCLLGVVVGEGDNQKWFCRKDFGMEIETICRS